VGLHYRVLIVAFILGWPLEWVPIVVVICPIFLPILQSLKVDMVWFGILLAVTLQSCWLSPRCPVAYYLKAIMPEWELTEIYKGMMPFMFFQALAVALLYLFRRSRCGSPISCSGEAMAASAYFEGRSATRSETGRQDVRCLGWLRKDRLHF